MHEPWEASPFTGYKKEKEVKMLCHDTHFSEADSIITSVNGDEEYQIQFKAFRKCGKGGSSTMTTYQMQGPNDTSPDNNTKYNYVFSHDELFPGYYSWWSPVDDENQRPSLFGTIGFSAKVDDLIECYKKAFDPPLEAIQFRCGGTLRYMIRVCKVIIICPEESQLPKEDYPVMPIKETEIKVQYENPYTCSNCIYDEFTFVFYFPRDNMQMECPEQAIICKRVPHNFMRCATKGRSCPGGIGIPEQLKLKLENMKKRREESEIVAIAQNVSPQANHDTESPSEEEFDQEEEGGMTYDQEHVMQQLEEEEGYSPACEDKSHGFIEDEDEDEDQEPLNKKLAMTVDHDDGD